jgi:glycosyltransferase involved in cell wall biosynthesis
MKVILVRSRAIDPSIQKYAESLAHAGFDVTLLLWDRKNQISSGNSKNYAIHCFKLDAPYDSLSVILYHPLWMMYEFIFLIKNSADVIHACDLDTLYPAILAKFIKKSYLCYTIFDFYSENLPSIVPDLLKKIIAYIEKVGIQFTDVLFLVDEARIPQIKGAKIKKIEYIYNTPQEKVNSGKIPELNKKNGEIIIFYAGSLDSERVRSIKMIIEAVSDIEDIKLIVAGTGQDQNIIEKIAANPGNNIEYLGWISYEDVINFTYKSDILFAFYDPSLPNNRLASPNKLFEAMMCSKPIIVNNCTSMADIVSDEKNGFIVPYGDIAQIKEAIINLINDPSLREKLGENGRKAYVQKYSWKIMEKRLVTAYKNL